MKLNRLLTAGFILAGLTLYVACRKTDRQIDKPAGFKENEKFFSNHRTNDPTEAALVDFIRRKNEKSPFIDKVISQIGYPYWDKTLSFNKPINTNGGRGNSGDSASIYYIPFVRDSQNYVNASLTIKIQQGDTTMRYACDWQYQNRVHGSPNVDTTAEKFALFFMMLDNRTFGYTEFDITDNDLFQEAVAGPGGRRKLGVINITGSTGGRNNLMVYNEVCMDFYICGDPLGEYTCYNQCDYLNCAAAPGQPYHCYSYSFCEGWWEETGGGGGTGTGGTGTGGTSGGSGGTGGTTPPPCPTGTVTPDNVTNPCGPGWNPTGGTGTGGLPPEPEPIDTLLARYSRLSNLYRDSLASLCESEHKERFFNIVNYNNQLDTFRVLVGQSDNEVKPNYYMVGGRVLKACWHYHPKYSDGTPGSWPSGADVTQLYDKPEQFVMIIDTETARYALVVENKAKMDAWKNIFGNGPNLLPKRVYNSVMSDPRAYSSGSTYVDMTKEKLQAAMGSAATCGIGLYQANSANGTTFVKIN